MDKADLAISDRDKKKVQPGALGDFDTQLLRVIDIRVSESIEVVDVLIVKDAELPFGSRGGTGGHFVA